MKGKFGRMSVFLANLLLLLLLNCVSAVTDTDHEMCSCSLTQPTLFSISCDIRMKSVWSVLIKSMAINLKRKCHQSDVAIYIDKQDEAYTHAHVYFRQLNHDFHDSQSRRYEKWWPLKLARHDVYNVQCHHTDDYVRHCEQRHPHATVRFLFCVTMRISWPLKPFGWMHSAQTWRAKCFECATMHRVRQSNAIWIGFVRRIFIIVEVLFVSCIVETWNAQRNGSEKFSNLFEIYSAAGCPLLRLSGTNEPSESIPSTRMFYFNSFVTIFRHERIIDVANQDTNQTYYVNCHGLFHTEWNTMVTFPNQLENSTCRE